MKHEYCGCNRRTFLRGSGLTLAGIGLSTFLPSELVNFAMAAGGGNKKLLFIYLSGGCDVINTVIPHGDADYNLTNRPTLYIAPGQALNLNGFASFHPRFQDIMPVFNAGDLAVVHRVGYPTMTLSHFDGYKIWHGGDPAHITIADGWLYRYIIAAAANSGVSLPVLTVNGSTPGAVNGANRFVNIANPGAFDYIHPEAVRPKYRTGWQGVSQGFRGLEPFRSLLSQTSLNLLSVTDTYKSWDQANWNPRDPNTGYYLFPIDDAHTPPDPSKANGKKFGLGSQLWFQNLKICALSLLEGASNPVTGTRFAGTELGGFDTHDGQGTTTGAHPDLVETVAYAIASLRTLFSGAALDNRNYPAIWDDTAVITFSEFGRTSRENGSKGTDHGQATFSLVAGGQVNGGVYNCDSGTWAPGTMFGIDGNYLPHRTDYRALFWELLRDHMGASPALADTVFPGYSGAGLQELNLFGA